eukprot:5289232-Prymnesium_polylepis.1
MSVFSVACVCHAAPRSARVSSTLVFGPHRFCMQHSSEVRTSPDLKRQHADAYLCVSIANSRQCRSAERR